MAESRLVAAAVECGGCNMAAVSNLHHCGTVFCGLLDSLWCAASIAAGVVCWMIGSETRPADGIVH